MLRGYASSTSTLRLGCSRTYYQAGSLSDDLDEIALCCPKIVDVSCYLVDVRLEYFGNMKKLDKLNIAHGSILPPSISGAPIQPFNLPITLLSLLGVAIPSPIDQSSLPLVRSLHLNRQARQPLQQLLPQLDTLNIQNVVAPADLGILIQESISLSCLSLHDSDVVKLDDASRTVIRERIVEFRVTAWTYDASVNVALAAILDGSKAMKKVILDGIYLGVGPQAKDQFLKTLKVMKAACKKKMGLWKENFEVGNGKVNLEK